MQLIVMGAGGVGGYYGALLARQGHRVAFVARGAHLQALRERGLQVRSPHGSFTLQPVVAVAEPSEASFVPELALFTVKTFDTEEAARALLPALGPDSAVLTFQNGVESVETLSALLGPDRVLAGTTHIRTRVAAPGVIEQSSPFRTVVLGEPSGEITPRLERIAALLRAVGLDVTVTTDARRAAWEKFIPLVANASLTSACQSPIGPIRESPAGLALLRTLVGEIASVGRATGVALPDDAEERALALLCSWPPETTSSMHDDFAGRRRVELEHLTGAVVRLGRRFGVATPASEAVYAVLKVRALSFGGL